MRYREKDPWAVAGAEKEPGMKTNWVERVWVNGPWRIPFQAGELRFFKGLRDLQAGARILEVGCGRGVGARLIQAAYRPRRLDAIDIDPDMIRKALRRFGENGASGLFFTVADAEDLPFADSSMDGVFDFGILHHLEDWRRGVGEIARVLKRGGLFCFEEIFPPLYAGFIFRLILAHPREDRFHGPEFRAALDDAGLRQLKDCRESRYTILGAALKD